MIGLRGEVDAQRLDLTCAQRVGERISQTQILFSATPEPRLDNTIYPSY